MMKKNMKLKKLIALAVLMGGVSCCSSVWAAGTVIKIGATGTNPNDYSATTGVGVDANGTDRALGTYVDKIVTWDGSTEGGAIDVFAGVYGIKTVLSSSVTADSITNGINVYCSNQNVYGIYLASSGTNELYKLGGINVRAAGVGIAKGVEAQAGTNSITFTGDTRAIDVNNVGNFGPTGIYFTGGTNYIGTDATGITGWELRSITATGTAGSAHGIMAGGGENTLAFVGSDSFITATSSSNTYGIGFFNAGKGVGPATGTTTIKNLGGVTATSTGSGTVYGIYAKNGNDATVSDKFSVSFVASGGTVNVYSVGGDNFGVKFDEKSGGTTGKSEVLNVKTIVTGVDPDNDDNISSGAAYGVYAVAGVNRVEFSEGSSIEAKGGSSVYGIYLSGGTNYIGKDNKGLGSITVGECTSAGNRNLYGIYVEGGENEINFAGTGSSITVNVRDGNSYGISFGSSSIAVKGTTKITGLGSIVSDPATDGKIAYGIYVRNGNSAGASDPTFKVEFVDNAVASDGCITVYSTTGENYGIMFNYNSGGDVGKSEVLNVKTIVAGVDPRDNTKITSGKPYGINVLDGTNTVTFIGGTSSSIVAKSSGNADVYGIYLQNGTNYIGTDAFNVIGKELGCITVEANGTGTAYGISVDSNSVNTIKFAGAGSYITAKSSGESVGISLVAGGTIITGLGSITAETTGSNAAYGILAADGTNNITFAGKDSSITAKSSGEAYGVYAEGGTNTITGLGKFDVTFASDKTSLINLTGGSLTLEFAADGPGLINVVNNGTHGKDEVQVVAVAGSSSMTIKNLKDIKMTGIVTTKLDISDGTITLINSTIEATEGVKTIGAYAGDGDIFNLQNNSKVLGDIDIQGATLTVDIDSTSELHIGEITGGSTLNITNGGKVCFNKATTMNGTLTNNAGTVEVNAKGVSVETITGSTGADKYTFTLPVGIKNGDTMLNITGTTALAFYANDVLTVNVGNVVSDLKIADKITLINATTAMTGFDNITDEHKVIKNGGENWTQGKIGISTDNKQLTFTVIGIKYVDVVPGAVTGNIVTVASAKEATITNGGVTSTVKFNDGEGTATSQDGPWHNIYGGWSDTAGEAVNGNTVNINAGANISENVYGGYSKLGAADYNSVLITKGIFNATDKTQIYGGYGYSRANNNSVTITNGIFNSATTEIYGGDPSFNSSESNSNNVTVSGGTFNGATNIYGGYVYGVALTKTNSNNVTISGGTFSGITNIYGGYEQGAMGAEADNNIVTINGGTFNGTTNIYGGYGVTGTSSGNTLVVGMKNLTVAKVADFQKYTFTLPVGSKNGDTMLNITGTTALTIADGDVLSVNNVVNLADGDTITLITEATGTFNLTGLTFYLDGVELTEEVGEYFKLANNDKSITFTKAVLDVDIKPINKTSGNIVTVTGDRTATVEGETIKTPREGRNWKNVYGGYAENGDTTNNRVTITAGTIKGDVYGGYSKTGNATGNIVTWESGTIGGELYGGYSGVTGKDVGNNWLKIVHKGETKTIKALNNFSSYVFDINAAKNNDTVLKITEKEITLLSGEYTVVVLDKQNEALKYEGSVCLIDDVKGIVDMGVTRNTTEESDGIVDTYGHYAVEDDGKKLIYTKTSEVNKDGSKAPVEGVAAAASTINTSSDLVLGAGISNLITSTAEVNNTETFAASSYNKSKLKTGSHADVSGYGVVVGVGRKVISKNGNKTTGGLFFEYANNNYDTFNNGYNGDGKSIHKGAGYIMRWDNKSGNYYEGMVHAGKVTNNWNNGASYHYDMSPTYYGAAATYGHKFMLGENKQLSIYGSYIYNHIGDGDAVIGNYKYNFEATKSQRTKVGVRYALSDLMDTKKFRPYVGLAWEHEFDGESNASFSAIKGSFNGRPESPSMKGDTGILEIGCKQEVGKWTLGIGAEVFTGKRRGWNGTLQATYNF